jgi:threonylcarbamoyladenosine tRNA methylthiotransferase MtaB
VVLAGVHIGGYGSDFGSSLLELVRAVLHDTDMPRVRIGSLEPWDIPEAFWNLFADPRLQPHLHLPLQSGSDAVLRRMARRCKTGEFARLLARARHEVADFNATTDVIVGFPGETREHWRETLRFVETVGFGHLHIFPYSPRQGTKAATLPDQIPPDVKKARCAQLHTLGLRLKREVLAGFAGRCMPVLVEGRVRDESLPGHWFGYTPNYLQVLIPAEPDQDLGNRIVNVELGGLAASGEALLGSVAG